MGVDLSGALLGQYEQARKRADEAQQRGDQAEAARAHRQCATLLRQYAEASRFADIRAERLAQADTHEAAAARLLSPAPAVKVAQSAEGGTADNYQSAALALIHRSTVRWDDIGGLEGTKREIKAAYGLSLARKPEGVQMAGWRNILFYGPPGTGKTLLAAATSNGLDATFFSVKVSDMLSKYFGESSRLISALYAAARRLSPAVVFLDEFEAITPQRGGDDSGAERRMVSTLLPELDGLATKDSPAYVLTVAATNLPWLIDKAMLSRFEKKIYIPLPDEAARETILRLQIEQRGHSTETPYATLVARTQRFSGRELERLCKEAIGRMTDRTNPDLVKHVDAGREAIAGYQIRIVPLAEADWAVAFEQVRPETAPDDLREFEQWRRRADE